MSARGTTMRQTFRSADYPTSTQTARRVVGPSFLYTLVLHTHYHPLPPPPSRDYSFGFTIFAVAFAPIPLAFNKLGVTLSPPCFRNPHARKRALALPLLFRYYISLSYSRSFSVHPRTISWLEIVSRACGGPTRDGNVHFSYPRALILALQS